MLAAVELINLNCSRCVSEKKTENRHSDHVLEIILVFRKFFGLRKVSMICSDTLNGAYC